ncbi:hypothetical protein [Streptomyces sp. NBC_00207]|uniref:hypothetical protein n=1 Tax=unclassified Streptomyces TaxID=2593676 RepID=UPI002886EEE6|nr:hypothetical protein [Streptomyces sp. DSM 41633]
MAAKLIVYPPDAMGWRRVRYDGTAIGVAHRPSDIRVLLAAAGLEKRRGRGPNRHRIRRVERR